MCMRIYIHLYIHTCRQTGRRTWSLRARQRDALPPRQLGARGEGVRRTGSRQSLSPRDATAWCWRAAPNRTAGAGVTNADACRCRCTYMPMCVCVCVCARARAHALVRACALTEALCARAAAPRRGRAHAVERTLVRQHIRSPCTQAAARERRTGACQRQRRRPASLEQRQATRPVPGQLGAKCLCARRNVRAGATECGSQRTTMTRPRTAVPRRTPHRRRTIPAARRRRGIATARSKFSVSRTKFVAEKRPLCGSWTADMGLNSILSQSAGRGGARRIQLIARCK